MPTLEMLSDLPLYGVYISVGMFFLGVLMIFAAIFKALAGRTEEPTTKNGIPKAPIGLIGLRLSKAATISLIVCLLLHFFAQATAR
jgi:hypothetical protein